jgi:HEAT repeat protein
MNHSIKLTVQTLEKGSEAEMQRCLEGIWNQRLPLSRYEAIPTSLLLNCLEKAHNEELKDWLITFVGIRNWNGSKAAICFQRIAKNEREPDAIRKRAISFLGMNSIDFAPCFDDLLQNGKQSIRETVASSLGQISVTEIGEDVVKKLFLRILHDKSRRVRETGLGALRSLWDEKRTHLDLGAQKEPLISCYTLAASLHVDPENSGFQKRLLSFLVDQNREVKETAAFALEEARKVSAENLSVANQELKSPSSVVRACICGMLFHVKPKSATLLTNIGRCLQDTDPEVRGNAALTVGKLQMKELTPKLVALLEEQNEQVRRLAISSLALMGDSSEFVLKSVKNAYTRDLISLDDVKFLEKSLGRRIR